MKPNMIKKWSIALLVAAGAAGLTGCDGLRVDEGASESDHSGIVADRTITGKLSGIVVDEYGQSLEGVSVSAYGVSTETDAGGTWTLENVPITNLVIANVFDNGTNTDVATDADSDGQSPVVANGKIYTSFSKTGYSTFHSTYEGAIAVITHSGDESGANSIVVDGISATIPYVELAQMNRTFEGMVYDLGESSPNFLTGLDSDASGVQLRLVPSYVDDDLYGFDGDTGDDLTSEEFSPGYYGLDPLNITLTGGAFKIENGGALRDGYELRVDGTEYKPAGYPIWNTGVTQNLIPVYLDNSTLLTDAFPGGTDAGQTAGYWKINKLNIATGANSLTTKFGDLFVVDYDSDAGDLLVSSISYHNGPYNMTVDAASGTHDNDTIFIDSDLTAIDSSNAIIVVFDEDIRSINKPELAAKLYNDELVLIDTTVTISGRTLSIAPTAALEKGGYRLVLKRDSFIGKDGGRLGAADPDQVAWNLSATDAQYDSAFYLVYGTSEYLIGSVDNLTQGADDTFATSTSGVAAGGTPNTYADVRMFVKKGTAISTEETRVEQLQDTIYHVLVTDTDSSDDNASYEQVTNLATATVDTDNASVSFEASKGTDYRLTVTDGKGTAIAFSGAYDATVDGIVLGLVGANTTTTGNANTDNFSFSADTAGTATVFISGVQVGYTVAVTPFGELGTTNDNRTDGTAGGTLSTPLVDQFHPRVALQFASENGQDNGSVAIFNLQATDETGEAKYGGETQIVYPKLNLTASLYDSSGLRGRSEDVDTNVVGTAALADALATNSRATPLLAITSATTEDPGETYSGRSDAFYTKADYDNWYYTGSSTSGTPCTAYYVANILINNATGVGTFANDWYVSDANGNPDVTQATVLDEDGDQSTVPATLVGTYEDSGRTVSYAAATSGVTSGVILETPLNCTPGATVTTALSGPNAERTIVIETTEEVGAIDFTSFKSVPGATLRDESGVLAARTNVQTGTNLDNSTTGLLDLDNDADESHMLAKLGDWRSITDTPRWTGASQNNVANTVGEGVSVKSLLQIVGVEDTADVPNAAQKDEHATGVILADGTPAMAYDATVDENSFSITFDQPVRENSDNITIIGAYDNYTITYTAANAAADRYQVYRHTNAYVDPFGRSITAGSANALSVTVSSASFAFGSTNAHTGGGQLTGETVTYTLADNATHDFSGYFAAIGHNTVTHDNATDADSDPLYYVAYDYVMDTNFNSWAASVADDFDVYDSGSAAITNYAVAGGPRLIGTDTTAPKLLTVAKPSNEAGDNDTTFLYLVGSTAAGTGGWTSTTGSFDADINLVGAHVTTSNDNDTEYTSGAGYLAVGDDATPLGDNETAGYVQFASNSALTTEITDDNIDFPLYFTWNNNRTSDMTRIPDNDSNYNRVVLRFDKNVTDVTGARVFYYKPTSDNLTESGIYMPTDGALGSGTNSTMDTVEVDNESVGFSTTIAGADLVFRFPDMQETFTVDNASTGAPNQRIVVDNVTIGGVQWTMMVHPPASSNALRASNDGTLTAFNAADTSELPQIDFYRKVFLSGGAPSLTAGDDISASVDNTTALTFVEPLVSAAAAKVSDGSNYTSAGVADTNDLFTSLTVDVADSTPSSAANNTTAVTVDLEATIGETTSITYQIGHGFSYSVTATDNDGESSTTTITLQRDHGANISGGGATRAAVLNTISGNSLTY